MSIQNAKLNYSWNSFEDMFAYYLQTDGVLANEKSLHGTKYSATQSEVFHLKL